MIVCLFACYYYYYLTQYAHARTMPVSYAYVKHTKDEGRTKCRDSHRVYRDCPIYTPRPSIIHTCTRRKPRRWLAMLLMIRAFSARHPAMAFIPGVSLICHRLLFTGFCPDDVPPFELLVGSDKLTPMRVIRWSDDAYITHHYAAAAPNLRDGYAGT